MTGTMKHGKLYSTLAILLALVSCTNDEKEYMAPADISFSPAIAAATRSTESIYPQDTPFGVWAYSLQRNKKWESNAQTAATVLDDAIVTYADGVWRPTPSTEWPGNDRLTFFAYSPYGLGATFTPEYGIEFHGYDVTSGITPMFTEPIADCDKRLTNGCIPFTFIQTLADVEFMVRHVAPVDYKVYVKSITIDNISLQGNFNSLPTAAWQLTGDAQTIEFCDALTEVGISSQTAGTRTMLPQTPGRPVKVVVDIYNDRGGVTALDRELVTDTLKEPWGVGKYYIYNLVISPDEVTFNTDVIDGAKIK